LPGNVSRFYLEKRGTRIEKQMTWNVIFGNKEYSVLSDEYRATSWNLVFW
jgi:hypothetical protein